MLWKQLYYIKGFMKQMDYMSYKLEKSHKNDKHIQK